jgi:hypothetical protein
LETSRCKVLIWLVIIETTRGRISIEEDKKLHTELAKVFYYKGPLGEVEHFGC